MSAILINNRQVIKVTKDGDSLHQQVLADTEGDILSAACFSGDGMYYVPEESPASLYKWTFSEKPVMEVRLPVPVSKISFYRNKVYCAPQKAKFIVCYDPLSKTTECIDVHHCVSNFEPADHGFVVENESGALYGFHFNDGATKVSSCGKAVLLGHYKNTAVAATSTSTDAVRISERGMVSETAITTLTGNNRFVPFLELMLEFNEAERSLVFGKISCSLPPSSKPVQLLSVPEQLSEGECTLCFCEFEDEPSITLDCGHRFHTDCVLGWVNHWQDFRAKGEHIVFTNAVCPGGCKHLIRHPTLQPTSAQIHDLHKSVSSLSKSLLPLMPAKTEEDMLYYMCSKCDSPFFGGEKICFRTQGGEPAKSPSDLVCENCKTDFSCPTHKRDFVVYKCRYCCNPASHLSFGTRYMCDRCDARWTGNTEVEPLPCPGDESCPVGGKHEEYSYPIGCRLCMKEGTINLDAIAHPPAQ